MDEARAKFDRFKSLINSLPDVSPMYVAGFATMSLDPFLDLVRTTYQSHLAEGTLVSAEPDDIALLVLAKAGVAVNKMPVDQLYRFCLYVKYFLVIALGQ